MASTHPVAPAPLSVIQMVIRCGTGSIRTAAIIRASSSTPAGSTMTRQYPASSNASAAALRSEVASMAIAPR